MTTDCNQDNSIAQLSGGVDRVNVTYDRLPPVLIDAVLAAEDREFYDHGGVDPVGIARALWANLRNQDVQQGGSTITQQYVKNVYLTQERTYTRKLKEAALAVKLERELPKQEILLRYLNTIYFGRGAYGVEAASRTYFDKPVEQLTLPEAAYLAGLIRAPETADANRGADEATNASNLLTATRRRDSVLDAMLAVGSITEVEYDEARATAFETVVPRTVQQNFGRVANPEWGTEYYVDHVRQWLVSEAGFTDAEVFGGGLRVYSTVQMDRQRAASEAVNSTLDEPDDPAGALVAIDDSGAVRAMYGGNDYAASEVNLATGTLGGGGGRQPGSSFKPFALAEAVAQGIPLNKTYNAPAKLVIPGANDGEDWEVGNYGDAGLGRLDLVSATAKSSNTAYAQLMLEVGPENVVAMAKRLGITSPLDPFPATVLGTEEVSVLDMASAYSTFADNGVHIEPYVVTRVTDALGVVLWENEITTRRGPRSRAGEAGQLGAEPGRRGRHGNPGAVRSAGRRARRDDRRVQGRLVRRLHVPAHRCGVGGLPRDRGTPHEGRQGNRGDRRVAPGRDLAQVHDRRHPGHRRLRVRAARARFRSGARRHHATHIRAAADHCGARADHHRAAASDNGAAALHGSSDDGTTSDDDCASLHPDDRSRLSSPRRRPPSGPVAGVIWQGGLGDG